ncbi:Genetic interactor of prohibitin 5, mitochondrial [Nakaseomyces glabratus]|uniref:Genetic interactor of prohibitin 5, mitochondrial n=1 Tax=Candida glabrata TaxID=5478 RepID=A0A0W0CIN2_CANGB|nr:Genetic interactor of prohibitin 5, mitochondrial [Nakaseomyces glabratus]
MSQRVLEVFRGLPLLPLSHEIVARCWDRMVRQRDVYYQFAVHVSHCHERLSTRNLLRLVTHVHHVLAPMNELPAHLRQYQSEYHALVASWPTVTERQILDAMELGKGMAVRIPHNKTLRQMFEQHEVRSDVHSLWRLLAVQHPPLSRPHADELVRTLKRTLGTSRTDRSIARAYLQLLQRAYTYTYTYTDTEAEAQLQYSRVSQLVSH